jgi:TonB dependent receptor-like, beta-barrel
MDENDRQISTPGGDWTFASLESFLINVPKKFSAGTTVLPHYFRQSLFGGYLQDDWRWHRSLTLNLGIRYEMVTVPTDARGHLSNLVNITDPVPRLGSPYFSSSTLRNFEPRVGFAWDPFNNGKTAVRGGFGIVDSLPMIYEYELLAAAPQLPPGSFITGGTALLTPSSSHQPYCEQHPHRSYVETWNLNVQRAITPSVTALVGTPQDSPFLPASCGAIAILKLKANLAGGIT